jgi:hypothetical protein
MASNFAVSIILRPLAKKPAAHPLFQACNSQPEQPQPRRDQILSQASPKDSFRLSIHFRELVHVIQSAPLKLIQIFLADCLQHFLNLRQRKPFFA